MFYEQEIVEEENFAMMLSGPLSPCRVNDLL